MKKDAAKVFFQPSYAEKGILDAYCEVVGRSKTDVLREYIGRCQTTAHKSQKRAKRRRKRVQRYPMPKATLNVYQLALQHGLKPQTVYSRLRQGKTLEQALNGPPKGYFKRHWETHREELIAQIRRSHLKTYIATSPSGEQITITDLPEWCAVQDLPYPSVQHTSVGAKPIRDGQSRKNPIAFRRRTA
jgi:hypothetical protein